MTELRIRSARSDEHAALSALALRSKGHWGYPAEMLDAMREELTLSPELCGSGAVRVAERESVVVGFATRTGEPPTGELECLFVDRPAIGSGAGRALLTDLLARARTEGFATLGLDADPGAEAFYLRHGAIRVGESPSGSIAGRVLPRLEFPLG